MAPLAVVTRDIAPGHRCGAAAKTVRVASASPRHESRAAEDAIFDGYRPNQRDEIKDIEISISHTYKLS